MKNILVTGCGGAPTTNFVRSVRDADPKGKKYRLIGLDCGKYTIHRSECDKSFLCPKANDPDYIPYILEIIRREKIDFMHTQPESEVFVIGKNRKLIEAAGCKLFMPSQKSIEILRDKFLSYKAWSEAGIRVPRNIKIDSVKDLKEAFKEFGGKIWIRETVGAAGKGSISNPTFEMAKAWIDMREGWGVTVAAEHLTERTTTWQSLWQDGKLVVGQGRERLYWEMGNRAQSGVTGITGTGKTSDDKKIADLALKCIKTIDPKPHGIFSVDFTYDSKGIPNPTEINIGKFFTTHHFLSTAGCNMPKILLELVFSEYKGRFGVIDPCKPDMYWIRGMDVKPVMRSGTEIEAKEKEYQKIKKTLK